MLFLCILIVIVMWPDFVAAAGYVRRVPDLLHVRKTAKQACENLDGEYERLLRSHR